MYTELEHNSKAAVLFVQLSLKIIKDYTAHQDLDFVYQS
jgi:hypothetical protein